MDDFIGELTHSFRIERSITDPNALAKPAMIVDDTRVAVPCPYGCGYTVPMSIHINTEVEALHCDVCSLPFDIEIHEDGTVEPYGQDDPRFVV